MVKIIALDVAISTGWAFYDTSLRHEEMELNAFSVKANERTLVLDRKVMRQKMRQGMHELIDLFEPDCVCIEQPLASIIDHGKKRGKAAPLYKGDPALEAISESTGGINANAVFALNQLFSVAETIAQERCRLVVEVAPVTWQTLTKSFPGSTKERSLFFLRRLGIEFPTEITKKGREDAADAGVIAWWAAGHCQELKMLRNASEAQRPKTKF